ncbi:MAG: LolA family protein [Jiangellaceae bacterium]
MTSIFRTRRARWAVPVGTVTVVAGAIGVGALMAGASSPDLPDRSAAELLASVAGSEQPFSGTVVKTARLGLPELPEMVTDEAPALVSLLSGSQTARIWYSSPEQARFAVMGAVDETNVIRDGEDVWIWDSSTNTAGHALLPERDGDGEAVPTPQAPVSPQVAAQLLLAAVDPSTEVTVDGTAEVAGRAAYELVLSPREDGSLIDDVRLAVDGETSMPLRVQVNADGDDEPAFEVGFTSVTFGEPSDDVFRFNPPPGATVEEQDLSGLLERGHAQKGHGEPADPGAPTIVGENWTAVAVLPGVSLPETDESGLLDALLGSATTVTGPYGSGRMLETALVSALLLDDGRLLVGAVTPDVLEAAAQSVGQP